jgi:hypothetical protein
LHNVRATQEVLTMSLTVRILLTLAVLLLLPAYAATAGAQGVTMQISVTPSSGPPGTDIGVSGVGAQLGVPVQVILTTDGESGAGALAVVQVDPDASGRFAAVIRVPAGAVDGRYAVRAEQRNIQGGLLQYYWANFSVGPLLTGISGGLREVSLTLTAALAAILVGLMAFQGIRLALRRQ